MDILDRTICLLITSFSSFDGIHVCLLICLFSHSSLHSFCFSYVCSSKLYHNNSLLLIIPEQTIKSFISSAWDFSLYIWDLHYIFSYIYFNIYICFWEEKNISIFSFYYLTLALSFFHINILSSLPFIPCILGEFLIFVFQASDLIFCSVKFSLPFLHCRLFIIFYSHLSVISLPSNLFCLISYDFVLLMYEGKFLAIHLGWMQPLNLSFGSCII